MKTIMMILMLGCLCSCNTTAIYMVRHAEKATNTGGNNPPLTAAGSARALALKEALKDASIDAIIVSDLQRTQLTAQPLASHLNLQLIVIPLINSTSSQYVQAVADEITSHWVGRDVLIVTHNTLLQQIGVKLKTPTLPVIDESTGYDHFFVIKKSASSSAISKVAHARYGVSTPGR
jgi:probable phosphoglycerate mutase